jgi:hypothetical protein
MKATSIIILSLAASVRALLGQKLAANTGDLAGKGPNFPARRAETAETITRRNDRAFLVANEYAATNPAFSEGERKRIAWQRAQKKNPQVFGLKPQQGSSARRP